MTSSIIGSRAFTSLFRSAVRDVHSAVFHRDADSVTLTIADVGTVLAAALDQVRPSLAKKVESTGEAEIVSGDLGNVGGDLARLAEDVRLLAVLLLVVTLLALAGALLLSPDRRRTVVELGIGVAAAGVVLVVAYGVTRSIAIDHVEGPEDRAAAGAVWDAFLGDLRTAAWILAGSGAVIAAAAASLIKPRRRPRAPAPGGRLGGDRAAKPCSQGATGRLPLAAGVVVIVRRDAVLRLLFTLAGVYLIYEGVSVILRLVYRAAGPGRAKARRRPPRPRAAAGDGSRCRRSRPR